MDTRQKHASTVSPSASISPQSEYNSIGNTRNYGVRSSGISRRGVRGNFVPPIRSNGTHVGNTTSSRTAGKCDDALEESTKRWLVSVNVLNCFEYSNWNTCTCFIDNLVALSFCTLNFLHS